jgi:hypothetical protein
MNEDFANICGVSQFIISWTIIIYNITHHINNINNKLFAYVKIIKLKNVQNVLYYTVSCRICSKNLDDENAINHMLQHDKKGEFPHAER